MAMYTTTNGDKAMTKQYKRVMRILDKHGFQIPYHSDNIIKQLVAAADYLNEKELVEMIRDYGF